MFNDRKIFSFVCVSCAFLYFLIATHTLPDNSPLLLHIHFRTIPPYCYTYTSGQFPLTPCSMSPRPHCSSSSKIITNFTIGVTSQYSEGPATGHLDTGFSWFPCVYKQMLRWFPTFQVATTCFSCSPPYLNLLVTNFIFCIHVK